MLKIACLADRKSYVIIIWANSCQKFTKNWVKLKSVQTLLRIAWNRKSYVVIIYANHVKSWPKAKLGQVEVRSNIVQNHLFSRYEIICGHYMCQCMWKVDQKWKCIKLKSVQILLKITGLAHRKSYVVIICANSVKSLPKVKIGSNISQNRFCSRYEVLCCHYLCQFMWKVYQKWNLFNYFLKIISIFPNLTIKYRQRSSSSKIMR